MSNYQKIIYILFFLLIETSISFSQENNDSANAVYNFPHRITIKTYFSSSDLYYTLRDKDAKFKPVSIIPNSKSNIGISFSYKSFGLSYSKRISESPYIERKYGKTTYSNFRLNYFYKNYGFDGYIQQYKGLYYKNPQFLFPDFSKDGIYPKLPNMSITTLGYNSTIKKNSNFSFKSIYYQSERQTRSIGSLVLMISTRLSRIKNDSSFIPISANKYMPEFGECNKGSFFDFAFAPGYAYTFVKDNYFISGNMYAGIGEQFQLYTKNDKLRFRYKSIFKYNFRTTAGYNGDNFFCKISYDIDLNTMRVEDSRQNILLDALDFTIGFRIK